MRKISEEQALVLKNFDYPFESATGMDVIKGKSFQFNSEGEFYLYPYLEEVHEWLRNEKKLFVEVYFEADGYESIVVDVETNDTSNNSSYVHTFEEALSDGVDIALDYLTYGGFY